MRNLQFYEKDLIKSITPHKMQDTLIEKTSPIENVAMF
nr:hypothetical protein [Providencia rettgeri]